MCRDKHVDSLQLEICLSPVCSRQARNTIARMLCSFAYASRGPHSSLEAELSSTTALR